MGFPVRAELLYTLTGVAQEASVQTVTVEYGTVKMGA
jgi:hypothetical protein